MATGYTAIVLTPSADVIPFPEGWTPDYTSDAFEQRVRLEDRFVLFDHEPTQEEKDAQLGKEETNEELRFLEDKWRLRVRFPVTYTTETRGGIARIFALSDAKLPAAWGRKAVFWWVQSTPAKLKQLHDYLYTTLGYGPVAGALAVVDPTDQSKFLPDAVRTATGLTTTQARNKVTSIRDRLVTLGYTTTQLNKMVTTPAGKTEDDFIRALVKDLGFTMPQLFQTMLRLD